MSEYFFPKLTAVVALAPYRLRSTWSTGEVLEVDVETRLRKNAALAAILDPEVFARARIGEWGNSIEWIDEEFGADNVYAWAKEQAGEVSHEMFGEWMHHNGLSLSTAAEALGISRRMVSSTALRTKLYRVPFGWPVWAGKPLVRKIECFHALCQQPANTLRRTRNCWIGVLIAPPFF